MTSKLSDQDKVDLVRLYSTGQYTITELAKKYNITPQGMSQLLKRKGFNKNDKNK